MNRVTEVGVIDKAVAILELAAASPVGIQQIVEQTGYSRPTVHRLVLSLVEHGLLGRTGKGYGVGPRLFALATRGRSQLPLIAASEEVMAELKSNSGESVQLFVREGESRLCVASLQSDYELRTIISVGAVLPIERGSGGKVLLGELEPDGFAESVGERESGVASVSAPVMLDGEVLAALSISGPIERMTGHPGKKFGHQVVLAANRISRALASGS